MTMSLRVKFFILFGLLPCLAGVVYAKSGGSTSATFLAIDPGARSAAMGGAMSGISEGAGRIYWNPGSLGSLIQKELSFSYLKYFEEIHFGNFMAGVPTNFAGNFALNLTILNSGSIAKTDIKGSQVGSFSVQDIAVGPAWGTRFLEKAAVGASLKYIRQSVDGVHINGFAADAGAVYDLLEEKTVTLGLALQNFGPEMKNRPLPSAVLAGIACRPIEKLLLAVQGDYRLHSSVVGRIGVEYQAIRSLFLRAGYVKAGKDDLNKMNMGIGFVAWESLLLDYAFGLMDEVENIHKFALTYRFRPS